MTDSCGTPTSAASGASLPAVEVCQKIAWENVLESVAIDNLNKEDVRDRIKYLSRYNKYDIWNTFQMSTGHRYGYFFARGLTLVETRDHPSTEKPSCWKGIFLWMRMRYFAFSGGLDLLTPSLRGRDQLRLGLVALSEDSKRFLHWSCASWQMWCWRLDVPVPVSERLFQI